MWRDTPSPSMVAASLAEYDAFYAAAGRTLARMGRAFPPVDRKHGYLHALAVTPHAVN